MITTNVKVPGIVTYNTPTRFRWPVPRKGSFQTQKEREPMSTTAEATSARDMTVVEADMVLIKRHLRRKIAIEWGRDNDPFKGEMRVGKHTYEVELAYIKKYDFYRFRMEYRMEYTDLIDRRFDITNHGAYPLVNDTIAVHSTLRLLSALDLDQD
jgi:hypothetical protein